jgi:negative regulator of replication initiation
MPPIELHTLLELVGTLEDSADPGSASARFRGYLRENVQQVGDVRTYVNDALAKPGDQSNKALQDLINLIGQLLEFDVVYGRYRGIKGQIGFDGLWHSPTGWTLVVEVKTTDVYTVKTATLLGYINRLISEEQIKNLSNALGLYVYGRFDAQTNQLENAIIVEGRRERLRVTSVDALLNLLELKQEYDLDHNTILNLLLPAPVRVDPLVNLIFEVVSQEKREAVEAQITKRVTEVSPSEDAQACAYYLLPAADSEDGTPVIDNLHRWLDNGLWGLGQRTAYRKDFATGDMVCFYAVRIGVVAEGVIASPCFELSRKENPSTVEVLYAIRLKKVRWLRESVELTAEVRSRLSAFQGRDPDKGWAWFVQGTSKLTEKDFNLLAGRIGASQQQETRTVQPVRPGPPSRLVSIPKDYKGEAIRAVIFQGERYEVHSWKDAMLALFEVLRRQDQQKFEETALMLIGRKRPYITRDKRALRGPQRIPNTASLYVETNLSANYIAKLCYTLITEMGYSETVLIFETEQ